MRAGQLVVDGRPRVLLCASVFPFRISRAAWKSRLDDVVRLGYDAVDVYIPWNVHEREPGAWDFAGDHDIEHFLELCAEAGLLVLARPGPYICAEWDGGGLPAWLSTLPHLELRQNESSYLYCVEQWFDQVMPRLARHQVTRGGPVALVQIENELDFFDCRDPSAYLDVLTDLARRHGIEVPLIACAGQGDIARSSGPAEGLVPTVNLYPDDDSIEVENLARYYESALRDRGLPLLVPETNRLHRTLKRLVVCGVRLLGPYLQTSGWNSGYGTSVNNWGDLLAFMTHDYDFGGVIAPDGTERADGPEARRTAAVIAALGERLAAGVPKGPASDVTHDLGVRPWAMGLAGGGELISLTQLASHGAHVTVASARHRADVTVPAQTCLLLVRDLPLHSVDVQVALCTGEMTGLTDATNGASLEVTTRGFTEIVLEASDRMAWTTTGDVATVTTVDGVVGIVGTAGTARAETPRGSVAISLVPAEEFRPAPAAVEGVAVRRVNASAPSRDATAWRAVQESGPAQALERVGSYRGAGRYRCLSRVPSGLQGLVLRGAGDLVQVLCAPASPAWRVSAGEDLYVPMPTDVDESLEIVTRTWGHSNFDDPRLPSLRLGSLRGIQGALAVTEVRPFSEGWRVLGTADVHVGDAPAPRGWFGGWMTAQFPQTVRYQRSVPRDHVGAAALRATGSSARTDVHLDGDWVGCLTPLNHVVWLGQLRPGQELDLSVVRTWGEPVGSLELLCGETLDDWQIHSCQGRELTLGRDMAAWDETELPLEVPAGTARWVRLDPTGIPGTSDLVVRVAGTGLLVAALAGDEVLGRMWTEAPEGAALKGGRGGYLLVPPHLRQQPVDLLLEATGSQTAVLEAITIGGPVDIHARGEG